MTRQRKGSFRLVALLVGFSLLTAAACGDDDDGGEAGGGEDTPDTEPEVDEDAFVSMLEEVCSTEGDAEPGEAAEPGQGLSGGELIDAGTFTSGPPETIDPAVNTTVNGSQVIDAMYDPLVEVNYTDEGPQPVGVVAESWESNEDASVWTFQIREGLKFSNGEDVLPSSFRCGWERAASPDFPEPVYYSYLFNFIQGGAEKLAGDAQTMSGIEADDENMTLTVTMAQPYAAFDLAVNHATFMPMPKQAMLDLGDDQSNWANMLMVGNGPFMLETERSDEEIVLVPNSLWDGTQYDPAMELGAQPELDKLTFRVGSDIDTAFNSFEAGEVQSGPVPPQRMSAVDGYPNTRDIAQLGTYYFQVGTDSALQGPENRLLRQAISQAINREEISETVWEGAQPAATSMVPEGVDGYEADLCEYCTQDPEAAETAYQEWLDAGNEPFPVKIVFNQDAGHEDVVGIMVDNLAAVGIEAEQVGMPTEDYFPALAEGGCVDICRVGWFADWPVYDTFLYDLFHSDSLGGNNYGYDNPEFDQMVDEAKQTVDDQARFDLFHQAEQLMLNDDIGAFPIAHYAGQYAYSEDVAEFPYDPAGSVNWARVTLN